MRAALFVFAFAFSLAGVAHAQLTVAEPADQPTAARQDTPTDPVRLELARRLVADSGGEAAQELRVRAAIAASERVLAQGGAPTTRLAQRVDAELEQQMLGLVPLLVDATERAYAEVLTEQELRDYVAWLESAAGKAITAKSAALQQDVLHRTVPILVDQMSRRAATAISRACEEEGCTQKERDALTASMSRVFGHPGA